jgi:tetratricopeptide (TPR) repeat protein
MYSAAIADICASWADTISPTQKGGAAARLQLIQKGLANQPRHLGLQLLLVQATHTPDDTGATAKQLLDDAMANTTGEAAAWWHFVLWTDARIRGDMPIARQHLQTAYQLAPQIPQIVNDMAMDLSTGNHDDLERSLKLIQSLLDKYPNQSGFRDTRGQILAKLGRYAEAVPDLEFSLPRLGNPVASQQILQKCYTALGRTAPVPQAHVATLLSQVRNLVSEQKYAEALNQLEIAMRESPNAACASAAADICVNWVPKIPPAQFSKRLELIQKGLAYVPEQPELKQMLLQAAHTGGDSGLAAKRLLDQLVAGAAGDAAADWHLSLGRDASLHGDLPTARSQLEAAYELAPSRTEIQAALAGILVDGSHDDWEKGLQLIKPALDQFPDNPEFLNSRGLLLAKLGQNKAAAADLEVAVAKLPKPTATRLVLAQVYDALGKTQLAEHQRRLAAAANQ